MPDGIIPLEIFENSEVLNLALYSNASHLDGGGLEVHELRDAFFTIQLYKEVSSPVKAGQWACRQSNHTPSQKSDEAVTGSPRFWTPRFREDQYFRSDSGPFSL